eukprot:7331159-Karenia_brevis.AAC.1
MKIHLTFCRGCGKKEGQCECDKREGRSRSGERVSHGHDSAEELLQQLSKDFKSQLSVQHEETMKAITKIDDKVQ